MSTHGAKKKVLLKIIILGESGVGKTALLNKYVNGKFIEEHKATIGADFLTREITVDDKIITLQIWDTAGQERFQSLGNAFYRGADACVLVYDILNPQTFSKIDEWRANFITQASIEESKKFPFLLLGNKLDKDNQRQVDKREGESYARQHGMLFYETSALNGVNVDEAIRGLASNASEMDSVPYFSEDVRGGTDFVDLDEDENHRSTASPLNNCACNLI
jgi:Ras-related protein Rab-7A